MKVGTSSAHLRFVSLKIVNFCKARLFLFFRGYWEIRHEY